MKKEACAAKVKELVENMAEAIKAKAMFLYESGAVNADDYSDDDYRLPKLLVTAAARDQADSYRPMDPALREELVNLEKF